ncbi:MAG: hypothetical protein M1838_003622 [Thelocarpon superellum]|nr:MAG: hypothetical protein M1838_003622 [Thelocarpon superellum]
MSNKLDRSLDEILSSSKTQTARRGRGRRAATGKANGTAAVGPVGGIKKNTRTTRATVRANAPTGPSAVSGDSKVIVSSLPSDVNEGQVKEYFHSTVGPVKKVQLTYGPNGTSRGIATVIFSRGDGAHKALKQLNGVLVDGRPIKIEVVLDASKAPPPAAIKALSERVAQPKAQPKSAAGPKPVTSGPTVGGRGRGRGGRGRGRNAGRAKPKTTEELDAEMNDYFDGDSAAAPAAPVGADPAVANKAVGGDAGMEDEIM